MEYSLPLSQWLASEGCVLYGKSDQRFLEGVYRVLRDVFNYNPKLTREQFLADGYAERKVMLTCDFLLLCQAKHSLLTCGRRKRCDRASKRLGAHNLCGEQQVMLLPPCRMLTHTRRGHRKGQERETSPPEVLTVQEGPGVGSVWSENVPVLAENEPRGETHKLPMALFPWLHWLY
jgi:hypothetical protein